MSLMLKKLLGWGSSRCGSVSSWFCFFFFNGFFGFFSFFSWLGWFSFFTYWRVTGRHGCCLRLSGTNDTSKRNGDKSGYDG